MNDPLHLAFVGALPLPEDKSDANPAFSPAGQMLQERIVGALTGAGAHVERAFVLRAVAAFPRTPHVLVRGAHGDVAGVPGVFLPFVNLPLLKSVTAAVTFFAALVAWGWRMRRRSRRAIVTYNVSNPSGLAIVLAGRVTRTAVFAIVADVPVPGSGLVPRNPLRVLDYRLQTRTLRGFDGLIALTERIVTDFAPGVPFILMEGAVPDRLTPGAGGEEPSANAGEEFVLMYSGGLSAFKGTPILLEAFAAVDDSRCRLWIAGAGDAQPLVEEAAGRDPRITYWGMLPNERVLAMYRRASVLVNPHAASALSARYVFPSKLLEYLAAGRPVISTVSTPEVEKVYGAYIYAVPIDDAAHLAQVIEQVLRTPAAEREAMAAAGRRFVLTQRTWSSQGRRMAEFMAARVDGRDACP